jgi:glycosyltransferase involved in cell wall biosynthesis
VISLVVSTVNRTVELDRLLTSLDQQTYKDFEVLIVDQNSDDRVSPILENHRGLHIKHLHSERGLSRGRNTGLPAATGSVCAVPDDDCWYAPELLHSVSSWFSSHPDFGALVTSVRDECGNLQGPGRRSGVGCECDKSNIWYNGISYNAFWRRSVADEVGAFDESLGPGCDTKFQAGEETDFLLRAMGSGHRVWCEPRISVFHPSPQSIQQRILKQTYGYSLSTGYVLRKHNYSAYSLIKDFAGYSFAGALVSMCKADTHTACVRLLRSFGMLVGYALPSRPIQSMKACKPSVVE